jgi:hypothetical protein
MIGPNGVMLFPSYPRSNAAVGAGKADGVVVAANRLVFFKGSAAQVLDLEV